MAQSTENQRNKEMDRKGTVKDTLKQMTET